MKSRTITILPVLIQVFQIIGCRGIIQLSLQEIGECENYTPEAEGAKVKYELKKSDSEVSLSGSMDLDFVIDEDITYGLNASLWSEEQNVWDNVLTMSGYSCDVLLMVPKLWSQVAKAAKVSSKCPIQPGHYELVDFTLDPKNADLPIVFEGKFMLEVEMYKDDKSVMCQTLVLEGTNSEV